MSERYVQWHGRQTVADKIVTFTEKVPEYYSGKTATFQHDIEAGNAANFKVRCTNPYKFSRTRSHARVERPISFDLRKKRRGCSKYVCVA